MIFDVQENITRSICFMIYPRYQKKSTTTWLILSHYNVVDTHSRLTRDQMVKHSDKWHCNNWCNGCNDCHYFTTSLIKIWTPVWRGFKSSWRCVRDLQWWEALTIVSARSKASPVNNSAKSIYCQSPEVE